MELVIPLEALDKTRKNRLQDGFGVILEEIQTQAIRIGAGKEIALNPLAHVFHHETT